MKLNSLILLSALVAFTAYCGSSKDAVKDAPEVKDTPTVKNTPATTEDINAKVSGGADSLASGASAKVVADLNAQLAKITLTGFDEGKSEIATSEYESWVKASAPVVSGAISSMPAGYKLQVTGHCSSTGDDATNDALSLNRAKFVKKALAGQGVTSPKLTVKGKGKRMLANKADPTSSENRRVEFVIVK